MIDVMIDETLYSKYRFRSLKNKLLSIIIIKIELNFGKNIIFLLNT